MYFSFLVLYFLFIGLKFTNETTDTFKIAFELPNSKIMFVSSSIGSLTIWKIQEGSERLFPCEYNILKRKCTDFLTTTEVNASMITSIKEIHNETLNETSYYLNGYPGYFCFRSQNSIEWCRKLNISTPFDWAVMNVMDEHSMNYAAYRIGNQTRITRHWLTEDKLNFFYSPEIIIENTSEIFDLTYSNKQLCLFYSEITENGLGRKYKMKFIISTPSYTSFEIGELIVYETTSSIGEAIEATNKEIFIYINEFLFGYSYESENSESLPLAKSPVNILIERHKIKMIDNFLSFISEEVVQFSSVNYEIKKNYSYPNSLNLNKLELSVEESTKRMILFEKQSNKIYTFPEVIFDEEEEEEEEEIEFEEPSLPENSVQFIKICPIGCLKCSDGSPDICEECKFTYTLNEDNHCKRSTSSETLVFFTNVFNVLRPTNIQSVFFAFVNFDLYNLHKTEYSGFFSEAITFANTMEEDVWNILPFEVVKKEIKEPFNIQSYFPYTNEKFIGLKGTDSFFFQSTKAYFQLYVPITLFVFVFIRVLRKYSITVRKVRFLKTFSFWLNFLFMAVLQNSQYLCIYAVTHFLNFFTFNLQTKILSGFCLYTIFFIFIVLVTLTPIILYEYKDECHSFLSNLRYHNVSIVFMGLKYILKPFVESMFHILLFEHSLLQKSSLIALSFLSICVFVYIETKYSLSETKTLFWLQTFEESFNILLNFFLILRYENNKNGIEIERVFDFCVENTIYFYIAFLVLEILQCFYEILRYFIQILCRLFAILFFNKIDTPIEK